MEENDRDDLEEKEIEDHSGESLCETCLDREECHKREETEPMIFEDQYLYCHEIKGVASYRCDEDWIEDYLAEG